jgi:hypothetical protein
MLEKRVLTNLVAWRRRGGELPKDGVTIWRWEIAQLVTGWRMKVK